MKQSYSMVYDLNRQMMDEYRKRGNQHKDLVDALKAINSMIQLAADLRGACFQGEWPSPCVHLNLSSWESKDSYCIKLSKCHQVKSTTRSDQNNRIVSVVNIAALC